MPSRSPVLWCAAFLTLSLPAVAQTPAKRDPKVQAVIDQTAAAYKALNGFRAKVSVSSSGPAEMLRGAPEAIEIRFQKPNKLFSTFVTKDAAGKPLRRTTVADGASLWTWSSDSNTYVKSKAPALLKNASLPNDLPEIDLLVREKDVFADLPAGNALAMAGADKIGGVDVDVLKTTATETGVPFTLAIQIMIGQKDRLIHGMTFEGSGKDPSGKDVKFDLRMTYDVLDVNPPFAPGDFVFTPPPGSKPAPEPPKSGPAKRK